MPSSTPAIGEAAGHQRHHFLHEVATVNAALDQRVF